MRHVGIVQPVPFGLVNSGPLVEVTITPHPIFVKQLQAANNPVPSFLGKMMIDTGAQKTVIEQRIATQLGLPPIRFQPMVGVSQQAQLCPVYMIGLTIGVADAVSTGSVTFAAEVIGMPSPTNPAAHVGLIGRDFLMHVRLIYDGGAGRFEIIFAQPGVQALPVAQLGPVRSKAKARRKEERKARRKGRR